jgi:hypothetical protein
MGVYVDDVRHAFGNMVMCHMWSDTEDELLAMADRIGVQRKWIQGHPTLSHGKHRSASWVHFDIALSKKALAVAAGAVLTDRYGPSEFTSRQRLRHPDKEARARARLMIKRIKECRKLPS